MVDTQIDSISIFESEKSTKTQINNKTNYSEKRSKWAAKERKKSFKTLKLTCRMKYNLI